MFGEMSTPPPQPLSNHAWYREKRKGRKIPQAMFQRKTILFLSLHKQDYTFFHVFTFLQYISFGDIHHHPRVSFSRGPLPLSFPTSQFFVCRGIERGRTRGLRCLVVCRPPPPSSVSQKKTSQEGGKIPERTEKRIFFSYSFFRETDRRECNANFYFGEREREMMGKGGPGGSIGGGSKEGGGMERKLLFSISARSEKRGPEAKKGLIPESWGPFKKALFLLQRWEGAGSVCRWESAPPRLNSHLSFLSFLLSLFLVI